MKKDPIKRFWEKVSKQAGQGPKGFCWQWRGSKKRPMFSFKGMNLGAARFAYEIQKGKIPKGLWVLHKCDNPICMRGTHLFLGTRFDNLADMFKKKRDYNSAKTHCVHGHPYDKKNTGYYHGRRWCRACSKLKNDAAPRKTKRRWLRKSLINKEIKSSSLFKN